MRLCASPMMKRSSLSLFFELLLTISVYFCLLPGSFHFFKLMYCYVDFMEWKNIA